MSVLTDDMRDKAKGIVCDILELEPDEVTETSLFVEDHGADSMRAIEILASLELNFRVTIHQQELERLVNLTAIYEILTDRLAASSTA